MTKVNFYQLKGDFKALATLSCQLVEKAWQMNNDIVIYAPDENTAEQMGERLWSWSAASFLPHRYKKDGPELIQIYTAKTSEDEDKNAHDFIGGQHGLLINLAADSPDWFARFEILCEFVYGDEATVANKRNRYKFYKDRGYPLSYHDMTDRF